MIRAVGLSEGKNLGELAVGSDAKDGSLGRGSAVRRQSAQRAIERAIGTEDKSGTRGIRDPVKNSVSAARREFVDRRFPGIEREIVDIVFGCAIQRSIGGLNGRTIETGRDVGGSVEGSEYAVGGELKNARGLGGVEGRAAAGKPVQGAIDALAQTARPDERGRKGINLGELAVRGKLEDRTITRAAFPRGSVDIAIVSEGDLGVQADRMGQALVCSIRTEFEQVGGTGVTPIKEAVGGLDEIASDSAAVHSLERPLRLEVLTKTAQKRTGHSHYCPSHTSCLSLWSLFVR